MTKEQTRVHSLTRGQATVLSVATLIMATVGIGGAVGTYANADSVLHRSQTALGVVAAGEGATLVAALVMIGVTMLGQAAPRIARAALWLLPAAAATMGLAIAPTAREAVVYALTPLAMTASAEGSSFLARRIVAYRTGTDTEAQRRNAETMRQIAFHAAQSERHPDKKVRAASALKAWKLMKEIGEGDAQLGSGLMVVQRDRLTEGADTALQAMLTGRREPVPAQAEPKAVEPGETATRSVVLSRNTGSPAPAHSPVLPDRRPIIRPSDQVIRREPGLSPAEPVLAKTVRAHAEPGTAQTDEPETGTDERERQIDALAQRLRTGERLTKTSAAQILGVSPATAGRRLKDARERIGEGTGQYL